MSVNNGRQFSMQTLNLTGKRLLVSIFKRNNVSFIIALRSLLPSQVTSNDPRTYVSSTMRQIWPALTAGQFSSATNHRQRSTRLDLMVMALNRLPSIILGTGDCRTRNIFILAYEKYASPPATPPFVCVTNKTPNHTQEMQLYRVDLGAEYVPSNRDS